VLTPSPTVVAEFAERIMDGVDPAQATELREFVDSVHLHRKLPEPNPEQMAEHQRNVLAQEVEHVRHSLVREWLNRYGSVTRQQRGESIPLDEDLWPAYLSERKRDLILPMNDNALGGDGAFQVYRAFAANIRKLVDGSPDGYEVFDDAGTKLVIRHDGVSYVLVRMQSD
ncbi:hypothetical protein HY632_02270, partial [Candidatus Uhrbacteria bacterium]|nr:hypothetical protein [Candidatus Uhrbacteria bacterium]